MTTPTFEAGHKSSFPLFDWLRFILASVVALGHERVITWDYSGNLAVQVFFALSGWLIGGILLRTGRKGLPRFFFNRGARIWIPYFIAVIAIYGLGLLRDGVTPRFFEFLFYDVTFTHNWFIEKVPGTVRAMPLQGTGTHFWSISVEEQFYLVAPLLIVLLPGGKALLPWVLVATAAYLQQGWYSAISLGVLAAVAQRRFGDWHVRPAARVSLIAVAALLFAGLVFKSELYGWLAPIFALSVVLVTAVTGSRGPVGIFLGGMSYPLYLNHWMGTFAANAIAKRSEFIPEALHGPAAYLLAFAAGSISYLLIDRTIQKQRDRFFTDPRGRGIATTGYGLLGLGLLGGFLRAG